MKVVKHKRKQFQQLFKKEIFPDLVSEDDTKPACTFNKDI